MISRERKRERDRVRKKYWARKKSHKWKSVTKCHVHTVELLLCEKILIRVQRASTLGTHITKCKRLPLPTEKMILTIWLICCHRPRSNAKIHCTLSLNRMAVACMRLLWCATTMLPVRAGVAAVVVDCESVAWRWKSVSQHARTHTRTIHTERERASERQSSCWIQIPSRCFIFLLQSLPYCFGSLLSDSFLLALIAVFPLFLAPASKNTRKRW